MLALIVLVATIATDLESMLLKLDVPNWRTRETATMALARAHGDVPIARLEQRLQKNDLSPEQRVRVLLAIERRVFLLPRAALGVRMETQLGAGIPGDPPGGPIRGVLVMSITPGLPAEGVLQPGDVITRLGELHVNNPRDLVQYVQSRWPGTEIHLEALRPQDGGWTAISIDLKLGSVEVFPEAERPRLPVVTDEQRRTVERLRRVHAPRSKAIEKPVEPGRGSAQWIVAEVARQQQALSRTSDTDARAIAAARWRTWLKAVEMRLGDRFLAEDKRLQLELAQQVLQEALAALER